MSITSSHPAVVRVNNSPNDSVESVPGIELPSRIEKVTKQLEKMALHGPSTLNSSPEFAPTRGLLSQSMPGVQDGEDGKHSPVFSSSNTNSPVLNPRLPPLAPRLNPLSSPNQTRSHSSPPSHSFSMDSPVLAPRSASTPVPSPTKPRVVITLPSTDVSPNLSILETLASFRPAEGKGRDEPTPVEIGVQKTRSAVKRLPGLPPLHLPPPCSPPSLQVSLDPSSVKDYNHISKRGRIEKPLI